MPLPVSFSTDATVQTRVDGGNLQPPQSKYPYHPWQPRVPHSKKLLESFQALTPAQPLNNKTWTAIGPAPLATPGYGNGNISDCITGIAVTPGNANNIYAGTGEANFSADYNYSLGILISSDGETI